MSVGAIVGVVYGVAFLVCWRVAAGHFAYDRPFLNGKPDWGNGAFGGFGVALVWPLLPFFLLARASRHLLPGSLAVGAERRAVAAERERQIDERERRIARAERELGIE